MSNLISYHPSLAPLQEFWDEQSKVIKWATPIYGVCCADEDGFSITFVFREQPNQFATYEFPLFEKYLGDNFKDAERRIAEIVKFFRDEIV